MRVLFVSQEFPPETAWGGIATYVGALAPALARQGAEVHVLSVAPDQSPSHVTRGGVHVHRLPLRRPRGVGRVTRLPATWDRLSLARAVAREHRALGLGFDVCETPEWKAEGLFIRHTALVVRVHLGARQVFPNYGRLGIDDHLAIKCEEALIRRAAVVTGTAAQLQAVAKQGTPSSERMVKLDLPVALPIAEPRDPHPQRIVFVGRFERRKNPDVLVRAAVRVLKELPAAEFLLIGRDTGTPDGGSYVSGLRQLAEAVGVEHAVQIVDEWMEPKTLWKIMSQATVIAVPSRWESFGLVAAEASALGRPVVAADIPALRDVVLEGQTGCLAPVDDPEAWASTLLDLLRSPELADGYGAAGRAHIAQRFDPDEIARQTLGAYELALARRGGA